ncbi:MAG: hypothetical protein IJO50_05350, partial [Clostridia bacterium]|nr:hypothetical protein [Clostridia bacterium]
SNEFNLQCPGGWHPYDAYDSNHNPDNWPWYVELVKTSTAAVKAAHPDAIMINGAVGRYEDEWIAECIKAGILDHSDGFSIHYYDYIAEPEYNTTLRDLAPAFHQQMTAADSSKQAWVTENGWPSFPDTGVSNDSAHWMASEYETAKWYPRSMAINSNPEVIDKYFHYSLVKNNNGYFWTENNFGIVHAHDHRTPFSVTPAYISLAAYNNLVGPATLTNMYEQYGRFAYTYEKENGDEVIMVWSRENSQGTDYTCTIDGASNLNVYDMFGNLKDTIANGSTITFAAEPVYVVKAN